MRILHTSLLAIALITAPAAAFAQDNNTTAATTDTMRTDRNDDRGFDWGWLGLIGLAGLAGLMKRDRATVRDTSATTAANRR